MSGQLKRYQQTEVIEHIASNYALGTLSRLARRRADRLRLAIDAENLNSRIQFWENKLSPLDELTPELEPDPAVWENLDSAINPMSHADNQNTSSSWLDWFKPSLWPTAAAVLLVAVLSVQLLQPNPAQDELSYVAVLTNAQQQPGLVAATYGESQRLVLDIQQLPQPESGEMLELWVTSKTDRQARSLGEVPVGVSNFERLLSDAEWRLIKDSDELIITIEEAGGSPIGEPMGLEIARGKCVRLSAWQEQV